ncbi:MAG: hypothetical protein R2705_16975 [Ilumatobacteraceae bacterium]
MRPIAEKLITKAKKAQEVTARVLQDPPDPGLPMGDKEMTYKLVNDVAPQLPERHRPTCASASSAPPCRQHADGAHRTGLRTR